MEHDRVDCVPVIGERPVVEHRPQVAHRRAQCRARYASAPSHRHVHPALERPRVSAGLDSHRRSHVVGGSAARIGRVAAVVGRLRDRAVGERAARDRRAAESACRRALRPDAESPVIRRVVVDPHVVLQHVEQAVRIRDGRRDVREQSVPIQCCREEPLVTDRLRRFDQPFPRDPIAARPRRIGTPEQVPRSVVAAEDGLVQGRVRAAPNRPATAVELACRQIERRPQIEQFHLSFERPLGDGHQGVALDIGESAGEQVRDLESEGLPARVGPSDRDVAVRVRPRLDVGAGGEAGVVDRRPAHAGLAFVLDAEGARDERAAGTLLEAPSADRRRSGVHALPEDLALDFAAHPLLRRGTRDRGVVDARVDAAPTRRERGVPPVQGRVRKHDRGDVREGVAPRPAVVGLQVAHDGPDAIGVESHAHLEGAGIRDRRIGGRDGHGASRVLGLPVARQVRALGCVERAVSERPEAVGPGHQFQIVRPPSETVALLT